MKSIIKNTAVLLAIAVLATAALAFVYDLTKEPIAQAQLEKKAAAYRQVYETAAAFTEMADSKALLDTFNAARSDGSSVEEILEAKDAAGVTLGYVMTVNSSKGYGGNVKLALGLDTAARVVGYAVLEHGESPGFGANCVNADVREQFIGITDTEEIDGISGATITTNALKSETNAALELVKSLGGEGV